MPRYWRPTSIQGRSKATKPSRGLRKTVFCHGHGSHGSAVDAPLNSCVLPKARTWPFDPESSSSTEGQYRSAQLHSIYHTRGPEFWEVPTYYVLNMCHIPYTLYHILYTIYHVLWHIPYTIYHILYTPLGPLPRGVA